MTPHHPHSVETHSSAGKGTRIVILLAVLILLLAAVFAALWVNAAPTATDAEDAARSAERLKNLADLQAADQATLTIYGWNDRAKGVVRIPVDRAMELVLPVLNARSDKTAAQSPQQQP